MRREDREVKDFKDIIEILNECEVMRIALNDDNAPYILPLNFATEVKDEKIVFYFHSALEGKKLDFINKNPYAGFEADCGHRIVSDADKGYCTFMYKSVIGKGRIKTVPDEEKEKALKLLCDKYHPEGFNFNKNAIPRTFVYSLEVQEISGKIKK